MQLQQLRQYCEKVEKEVQKVDGFFIVNVQSKDGTLMILRFKNRKEAALFIAAVNAGFDRAFV